MFGLVLRSVGAMVASFVVAMLLIIAVEAFGAAVFPFPEGADTSDVEVVKAHVARYPHWVLAVAVLGWGAATFLAAWVATRLGAGRHPAHGYIIGGFLLLAAIFNMLMLPYPLWFEIVNLVTIPLATILAVRLVRAPSRPAAPAD